MKNRKTLITLTLLISVLAAGASLAGILSDSGPGEFIYRSIRGQDVRIYGRGIYRHMSAEVAIQGIAQDYITLFLGIPLLLVSLFYSLKGAIRWRFIFSGTLGYFFVTYLFYLVMAMYNEYFLVYTGLMGASFFALMVTAFSFSLSGLPSLFRESAPVRFTGGFLIFNALTIALLWSGIVFPPLLEGNIYPKAVEHYTTLIVQGIDLGLLLPLAFISGYLLIRKKPVGFLLAPSYLVFLSLLMTALLAKIIYMGMEGYNIIPVIFIIPVLDLVSIACAFLLLKNVKSS